MPVSLGQIRGLALLLGGIKKAAREIGVTEAEYQNAFNDRLNRYGKRERMRLEAQLLSGIYNYIGENPDDAELIERSEYILGGYQLTNEQEQMILDRMTSRARNKPNVEDLLNGLDAVNELAVVPTPNDNTGLTDKQTNAVIRIGLSNKDLFKKMLDALEEDEYNLRNRESAFWKWFGENYVK